MTEAGSSIPDGTAPKTASRRSHLAFAPLVVFAALAAFFLVRLFAGDPQTLPSALKGRPAPATTLPALAGLVRAGAPVAGLTPEQFAGKVTLLNVFASWCAPCRDEHPVLMDLARRQDLQILGLNYKDVPENARRFLGQLGNPYAAVGADQNGRAAIEWGVYGVPETFIISATGTILYKHVGPLSEAALAGPFGAALAEAVKTGHTAPNPAPAAARP